MNSTAVLVVDDDDSIGEVVQVILELTLGVPVVRAGDGLEALQKLSEARPTLVITDVQMPRLDGPGLIRLLKADPTTRLMPVIAYSAAWTALAEAREAGADDYLGKPFEPNDLVRKVQQYLAPLSPAPDSPSPLARPDRSSAS